MSIDKKDVARGASEESMESTPEAEVDNTEAPQDNGGVQQKRKGGRKPIYATSEERKQRNRQAQAAFRERRTEYIKQLEETIRVHETNLHNLQTAHRSAADECLMLRYKNSLLERILLEKGIDVQAELQAKTGSPHLGPSHMQPNMAQPTVQRAIMNRHQQARRSNSSIAPKLEPGVSLPNHQSPQSRPTPSSHASSPTSNSSGFANQGGVMTPPASDSILQQQHQHQLHQQQMNHQHHQRLQPAKPQPGHGVPGASGLVNTGILNTSIGAKGQGNRGSGSTGSTPVDFVSTEQEYDAQADMIEEQQEPDSAGPGPYPQSFGQQPIQHQPQQQNPMSQPAPMGETTQGYNSMTQQLMDPYDPMLDMDPFGLSASMQFPTAFSFDTSSMR
ncbi:putative meab protein [Coleophoma cylindrospora]|uniref:Putative meab protein n=1 Tax=Coleophoma cylindrospora TaxID=1849047 RepID=A0A3D8RBQ1_9HELO|nr:putative meab protein [Coleophoma cylindrospora]